LEKENALVNQKSLDSNNGIIQIEKDIRNCLINSNESSIETIHVNSTPDNPIPSNASSSTTRIKSSDYNSWDKFDVDEEIKKIDNIDEIDTIFTPGSKPTPARITPIGETALTDSEMFSDSERPILANYEKIKGNEYFAAGEYDQAVITLIILVNLL
jgi:hypothetical protein